MSTVVSNLYSIGLLTALAGLIWFVGSLLLKRSKRWPTRILALGLLLILASVVLLNTGWAGVAVLAAAVALGYWIMRRRQTPLPSVAQAETEPEQVEALSYQPSKYKATEDEIQQLKREKRFDEALALLENYMLQTEADAQQTGEVRSWPYLQAAIIYSKLKDRDREIAVVERFAQQPSSGSAQARSLLKRLHKLYARSIDPESVEKMPLLLGRGLLVDCETTGISDRDEVIELALVAFEYNWATGSILGVTKEYSGLREPGVPIGAGATKVHGLTKKDVCGHRLDDALCREMFEEADLLVAHNYSFDRRMVGALFPVVKEKRWACSLNGVNWKGKGHSSRKLQDLLEHYGIAPGDAHRALDDVKAVITLISQTDPETNAPYFSEMLDRVR